MSRPGVGSPDEFFDVVNKLESMVEDEKKWSSNNIMIEVATSLTDDTPYRFWAVGNYLLDQWLETKRASRANATSCMLHTVYAAYESYEARDAARFGFVDD